MSDESPTLEEVIAKALWEHKPTQTWDQLLKHCSCGWDGLSLQGHQSPLVAQAVREHVAPSETVYEAMAAVKSNHATSAVMPASYAELLRAADAARGLVLPETQKEER